MDFNQRQFVTRKVSNYKILERLEELLNIYFEDEYATNGLPSVKHVADKLNISPNYLTSLLKALTGENTLQHLKNKIADKAKEKFSTTEEPTS